LRSSGSVGGVVRPSGRAALSRNQHNLMKNALFRLLFVVSPFMLSACSKNPVDVTGQIFFITQGRENIKMGGVTVFAITDKEFLELVRKTKTYMEQETRNYEKMSVNRDYILAFANEIREMEKNATISIPELRGIHDQILDQSGWNESGFSYGLLLKSERSSFEQSIAKIVSEAPKSTTATTDADGKFSVQVTEKAWFIATSEISLYDQNYIYLWIKSFDDPQGSSNQSIVISNEDALDSEEQLYEFLTELLTKSGDLAQYRDVEVSEETKILVSNYREAAIAIKDKAEGIVSQPREEAEK